MRLGAKIVLALLVVGAFAIGLGAGVFVIGPRGTSAWLPQSSAATDGHDATTPAGDEEHLDEHDEEDVLELSETAFRNLGLVLRPAELADYTRFVRMPAQIVEQPGRSTRAIAAPVNGVVSQVFVTPGTAIRWGDPLFAIQVIDQPLLEAELTLLDTLAQLEINQSELTRLRPLAASGSVAGRKLLELEYEQQQLEARRDTRIEELLVRGLTQDEVDLIVEHRKLVREVTVYLQSPSDEHRNEAMPIDVSRQSHAENGWDFTIEDLEVDPGQSVERGQVLCHLAYHRELYIRGQAFEKEASIVTELAEQDHEIIAEFGPSDAEFTRQGLEVEYVDNHVDPDTQTFGFFVPLPNEVAGDFYKESGQRLRTWRFKVGQRVHLLVPVETFADQIQLPRDAIVEEGPNVFVFRKHIHDDEHDAHEDEHDDDDDDAHEEHNDHEHDHGHGHDEAFVELEQVPVEVVYRDARHVVIAKDGLIQPGDLLAMNKAYQLSLALKSQKSGGGGGHQHHGH